MAIEYMSAIWKLDLDPTTKFVFITLADCADHNGSCFPSVNFIASRTGYSESTVKRALQKLCDTGYLVKQLQIRKNGSNDVNKYSISIPLDQKKHRGSPRTPMGATVNPGGPTVNPQGPTVSSHITIIDPSYETKEIKINKKKKKAPPDNFKNLFEQFWQAYPKQAKKAQAKAFESFCKHEPTLELTQIMIAAIKAQERERKAKLSNNLFAPPWKLPATWLNQKCWNDVVLSEDEILSEADPAHADLIAWATEGQAHASV